MSKELEIEDRKDRKTVFCHVFRYGKSNLGLNQSNFSDFLELSHATVNHWINPDRDEAPSWAQLRRIETGLTNTGFTQRFYMRAFGGMDEVDAMLVRMATTILCAVEEQSDPDFRRSAYDALKAMS